MVLLFFLPLLILGQDQPQLRSLPIPEARSGTPQGELWMKWSLDQRLGYVQGFLQGLHEGYRDACVKAGLITPSSPTLADKCIAQIPKIAFTSDQYEDLVTRFYTEYPQDKQLPIHLLLQKLSEPKMTTDGVHKWLDDLVESTRSKNQGK
jgi:hypothetical protein